jgi:hypothetical protein
MSDKWDFGEKRLRTAQGPHLDRVAALAEILAVNYG